jgi:hypothetical protein
MDWSPYDSASTVYARVEGIDNSSANIATANTVERINGAVIILGY